MSVGAVALPLRRYRAFVLSTLATWLTYRTSVVISFVLEGIRIAVLYSFWSAVYGSAGPAGTVIAGFTQAQVLSYVFVAIFVRTYANTDILWTLSRRIREGNVAIDLVRPLDFQATVFFQDLGGKIMSVAFVGTGFVIAWLGFGILHPDTLEGWLLFFAATVVAGALHFAIDFIVGLAAFAVVNMWGVGVTYEAVMDFFSGTLVPLAFFPAWLHAVTNALPFRFVVDVPTRIFLGKLAGAEALLEIATGAIWTIVLVVVGRLLFRLAVRSVVIHGG